MRIILPLFITLIVICTSLRNIVIRRYCQQSLRLYTTTSNITLSTGSTLSSQNVIPASDGTSSFNRFTRSIGDVLAYTTGDLSSGIMTLGKGIGKYIPYPISPSTEATVSIIEPVSSFKNLSEHSLVADTFEEPTYIVPNVTSIPELIDRNDDVEEQPVRQKRRWLIVRFAAFIWGKRPWKERRSVRAIDESKPSVVSTEREGFFLRMKRKIGLILRRRLYNMWDRSNNPSWSKFSSNSKSDGFISLKSVMDVRRNREPTKIAADDNSNKNKGFLQLIEKINPFKKMETEDIDFLNDDSIGKGDEKDFRIFKKSDPPPPPPRDSRQTSLISSVLGGISTSKDFFLQASGDSFKNNRMDGLFSDGKNLMAISVQMLSNTSLARLGVNDIGGIGSSFLKNVIPSGADKERFLVIDSSPALGLQPLETFTSAPEIVVDAEISEPTAYSPLFRFLRRKVLGIKPAASTQDTSMPGLLSAVPVVRLLPRLISVVRPSTTVSASVRNRLPITTQRVPDMSNYFYSRKDSLISSIKAQSGQYVPMLRPAPSSLPASTSVDFSLPTPSKADLTLLRTTRIVAAVQAALTISSYQSFAEFMNTIGLKPLLAALINPPPSISDLNIDAGRAINGLISYDSKIIPIILAKENFLDSLNQMLEEPFNGFGVFRSNDDKEEKQRAQYVAMRLIFRLVRESDIAIRSVRGNAKTMQLIARIKATGDDIPDDRNTITIKNLEGILQKPAKPSSTTLRRLSNVTTIADYPDWKPYEMARVTSWAVGVVERRTIQKGQRGLRILSFDGGGTRGVLSIAAIKALMERVGNGKRLFEMFDVICGTSTGGIIAVLAGIKRMDIDDVDVLYNNLISTIFKSEGGVLSGVKFLVEKAYYDDSSWEQILDNLCKDELMIDSNRYICPRVFCVSANVTSAPQKVQLWTNYNTNSSGSASSFRINTAKAVRITSAAPTYFSAVTFDGCIYVDGAIVANNPTDIAIREAKNLFKEKPELVVSIGTGLYSDDSKKYDWVDIGLSMIAAGTDTERVHQYLEDNYQDLGYEYIRLNPQLDKAYAIDEKSAEGLENFRRIGREYIGKYALEQPKKFENLLKLLRGS